VQIGPGSEPYNLAYQASAAHPTNRYSGPAGQSLRACR
jgi:hypothetical protein